VYLEDEAMAFYMRFLLADGESLTLSAVEQALKEADPAYAITDVRHDPFEDGVLAYGGDPYGQIEINPIDPSEDEEIEELKEEIEHSKAPKPQRQAVLITLQQVRAMLVLRVLWQDRTTEATLQKIDPLWKWLFATRDGILQVDSEGYYDRSGLVLAVE
jgi:hypothetical protein